MILQTLIIFGCLAVGELIVYLTGIKFPSSIIGMLLLLILLKTNIVKLKHIEGVANVLVKNIGFFFIAPGIAVMMYFDLIQSQFWQIVVSTVVSTIIVLVVTGWSYQLADKKRCK